VRELFVLILIYNIWRSCGNEFKISGQTQRQTVKLKFNLVFVKKNNLRVLYRKEKNE